MDLQALTDFALVATHGGFARAARASGRSKATLSRRVSELEEALGVRLIERGTQSLRLTDEGRLLHERTHGPLSDIAEAEEAVVLGASIPRGRLRVSAPVVLAHLALGQAGARFALAFPEVQLEIVAQDRKVDPVEDNFDLILRVDPAAEERMVGRCIVRDQRYVVAHPDIPLPPATVTPQSVNAVLLSHTPADITWHFQTPDGTDRVVKPQAALRLSSLFMVHQAVLCGAGAALLPKLLVQDDVRHGRLALWGVDANPAVEIWALRNSRRLVGAKVQAFLDVLATSFPNQAYIP